MDNIIDKSVSGLNNKKKEKIKIITTRNGDQIFANDPAVLKRVLKV